MQNMDDIVEDVDASPEPSPIPSVSPTPSSSSATDFVVPSSASEQRIITPSRKRARKSSCDEAIESISGYFTAKHARLNTESTTCTAVEEDALSVWCKSLLWDMQKIKCPQKQERLKIQISRIVQDEILKQLDTDNISCQQ